MFIELKGPRRLHHITLKTTWSGSKQLFSNFKIKGEYWFAKFETKEIFINIGWPLQLWETKHWLQGKKSEYEMYLHASFRFNKTHEEIVPRETLIHMFIA